MAFDHTRGGELVQSIREHLVGKPGQGGCEFGETEFAVAEELQEHERRPASTQRGKSDLDRTVRIRLGNRSYALAQRPVLEVTNRLVSHDDASYRFSSTASTSNVTSGSRGVSTVRVHHLDCGSLLEISPVDSAVAPARVVCHCLLIETDRSGLVLVDTGVGIADVASPRERLGADWVDFADPVLDPDRTAVAQIARLGFDTEDVRHIVLTHLHRDHTGGLPDFPCSQVHVHEAEYRAVTDPSAEHHDDSLDRFMAAHRAHGPRWAVARPHAGGWFGFDSVATLEGLPEDILLIPLPGHTPGHCGVAVRQPEHHGELEADPPQPHPTLQLVQDGAQVDPKRRLDGLHQLRKLFRRHKDEVDIFCAHDPWEFQRATHMDH